SGLSSPEITCTSYRNNPQRAMPGRDGRPTLGRRMHPFPGRRAVGRARHQGGMMHARSLLFALLFAASPALAGKLTLYTSQPDAIASETVAAFEAANPSVHVSVFRSGTTQVMNKLGA